MLIYILFLQRVAVPLNSAISEHGSYSLTTITSNFHNTASNSLLLAPLADASSKSEKTGNRMKFPEPLPPSVIDSIKTFVFFIGIPRSGHSIVAALLDSHPHIVISHELDIFNRVNLNGSSRSSLFNDIWNTSYIKARSSLQNSSKGYSLVIDGPLYQGAYQNYIDVIGDKKGGQTTTSFLANVELFQDRLNKLRTLVNLPIKVIHVIRNPYDNIATLAIYRHFHHEHTKVAMAKSNNETVSVNPALLNYSIKYYFDLFDGAEVMRRKFNLDTMDVHGRDLIANRKVTIKKMCGFLQVPFSDDYLNIVSRNIFSSESKTHYNVIWTDEQIAKVKENIMKYDSLSQYLNFNS